MLTLVISVVFVKLVFSDSTTDCYDVKELYEMIQRHQAQLDAITERGLCFYNILWPIFDFCPYQEPYQYSRIRVKSEQVE